MLYFEWLNPNRSRRILTTCVLLLYFTKLNKKEKNETKDKGVIEKIGEKATSVQLEKNYYKKLKDYYSNIRKIGLEYEDLDYSKSLDFLLMTVKGLDDQE